MRSRLNRLIQGMLVVLGAAYSSGILLSAIWEGMVAALFLPLFMVFFSLWFILPLGMLVGATMPFLVERSTLTGALFRSVMMGIVIGCLAALAAVLMEGSFFSENVERQRWMVDRLLFFAAVMVPNCVLWITVWALAIRTPLGQPSAIHQASGSPRTNPL